MPFEWTIDKDRKLITITGRGRGNFDEGAAAMRAVARDPGYDPAYRVLADMRESEYTPSLDETRKFVDVMLEMGMKRGPLAMVVSTGLQFGTARQLSAFGESRGREIEVFTGVRNALRWLERER